MANILVLNAGSGSQKVVLHTINSGSNTPSTPVWQAAINSTTPGTMGFTPMDGIAMCTRSGAVDPGLILHLLRHGGESRFA